MSVAPPICRDCQRETVFDGVGPFPPGEELNYGVSWRCPDCGKRSLDVCPLGPLAPDPDSCLNCGQSFGEDGQFCPDCGMTPGQVETYFGVPADPAQLLPEARDGFRRRLYRRGHALLNRLLQRDFAALAAWQMKLAFHDGVGFRRAKRSLLEQALAKGAPPLLRMPYGTLLAAEGAHAEAVAVFRAFLDGSPAPAHAAAARSAMARSLAAPGANNTP
jgi:hypothetical protein